MVLDAAILAKKIVASIKKSFAPVETESIGSRVSQYNARLKRRSPFSKERMVV